MLARDLDWAVARATAGNPAMRYASVTGLVEDLRRFLAGRPLLAVPDQRGYRWGKFVRRNRSGLAVAGVVVLALLTGLGLSLYGLDQARTQHALAEQGAHQLQTVSEFQQSMLEGIDIEGLGVGLVDALRAQVQDRAEDRLEAFQQVLPHLNGADIARQLVDGNILGGAISAIERDFGADPVLAADLRASIAHVRHELGMYRQSAHDWSGVLAERERLLGASADATLEARQGLARSMIRDGRPAEAKAVVETALRNAGHLDDASELRALLELSRSEAVAGMGDLVAARDMQASLYERLAMTRGEQDPTTIRVRNNLGIAYSKLGEHEVARGIFTELLAISEHVHGPEHEDTLRTLGNLAASSSDVGDYGNAMSYNRRLLEAGMRKLGERHPQTLATRSNMALDLRDLGRHDEALVELEAVLELRENVLGPEHPQTLMSRWRVAEVLARIERFDVALPMAREVLETQQRLLGARHPSSLLTALKYAGLLDLSGSRHEALALVDEALPAALEVIGDGRGEVRAAMRLKEGGPAG